MTVAAVQAVPDVPVAPESTAPAFTGSTTQTDLLAALKFVNLHLPSRPPMAVLRGVLLEGLGSLLKVSVFDYETAVTEEFNGFGSGRALVPGSMLQEVIATLDKNDPVYLRIAGDNLVVESGDASFTIPLLKLEDYPALPAPGHLKLITVTGAELKDIGRVIVAAGRDYTLPMLTAVCLDTTAGVLDAVCTDRYRLAIFSTGRKAKIRTTSERLLIPADALSKATRHFGKETEVTITYNKPRQRHEAPQVTFRAGGRTMITRTQEGEFPRFRMLIPSEFATALFFDDAKKLVKAVEQVATVAARNAPVRLVVSPESVQLEAGSDSFAKGSRDVHPTIAGGDDRDWQRDVAIGMNPAYVLDGIKSLGSGTAAVNFTSPTKPMVWVDPDCKNYQYLLMPVRLGG